MRKIIVTTIISSLMVAIVATFGRWLLLSSPGDGAPCLFGGYAWLTARPWRQVQWRTVSS
jgi:hypothetical protein